MNQRGIWDEVIGGVSLEFDALEMADKAGYGDSIGLSRMEQDNMIRAKMARVRPDYNRFMEGVGSKLVSGGMENSGLMGKAKAQGLGMMLDNYSQADLQATQASNQVLAQEQSTWMSLLSQRSQQVNAARQAELDREASSPSMFDRVMQGAATAAAFL